MVVTSPDPVTAPATRVDRTVRVLIGVYETMAEARDAAVARAAPRPDLRSAAR